MNAIHRILVALISGLLAGSTLVGPAPAQAREPAEAPASHTVQTNAAAAAPAPSATSASPPTEARQVDATRTSPLQGSATTKAFAPSNCWGKSNDPHVSTLWPTIGDIKGFSKTWCKAGPVPMISIKATVWRKRWWGYQRMGTPGTGAATRKDHIGRSGHWDGCQKNTWRTVGNHHVRDWDGRNYYAETINYKVIDKC